MAVDLKPTEAMAAEAERGLAWRDEYNRGGTEVGVARARDIKNRKNLSEDTVRRMVSYFARHEVDKQGEGFSPGEDGYPSAGRIAWALWGGDPGQSWANERARQLDNEEESKAMNKTNPPQKFYAMEKTGDDETTIHLYDEVGAFGAGSKDFLADLGKLDGQHIHLRINSPGGSVIEGTAIYNALRRHQGGLTVHIDALAASMASVIAMAGAPVYMADNALLMIHNPWTVSMGDSDQLRREADLLDKLKSTLVNAYKRKSGMEEEEIASMMDKETWLDAVEAVALGFADAIEEGVAAAATATPEQLRARFDTFAKGMTAETPAPEAPAVETPAAEEPAATIVGEAAIEAPAAEEPAPEAPATEEAPAEPQAKISAADSILAKHNEVLAQRDAAIAERDAYRGKFEALSGEVESLRASLAKDREDLERLKRSFALAPAREVPEITEAENAASIWDQWKNATGAEKTRILRANRKTLEAFERSQKI